ncbi:hypothetical protein D5086_026585 [Populus alba]|uniref:Uncharacterized protein n=1 Tax=Populus alba TaxID=43335 RepID=A0ACC4B2B1_POPAL
MAQRWFTHANPTLFNAGAPQPRLYNSIEDIYDTLKDCAIFSKSAGGFGIASAVHNILPTGSSIRGEDGASNGFVPSLRVFNHTDRYFIKEEGRGKNVELKTCSVLALRIPDLFMERVRGDGRWSLFCPMRLLAWLIVGDNNLKKLYTQHESECVHIYWNGTAMVRFENGSDDDDSLEWLCGQVETKCAAFLTGYRTP